MAATGLTRLTREAEVAQVIEVIERDGGVIIEGMLRSETLEGLRSDLLPLLEKTPTGKDAVFDGQKTRRLSRLFARTRHVADIAMDPLFYDAAMHFVSRPMETWHGGQMHTAAPGLQLGMTQAIQIAPGEGNQPLHRDDGVWSWRHPCERQARLQIMVAVSEFTAENGGTLVVPGSHKWDDRRKPELSEAIPTEMSAGSALLWIGSTFHAGGTNRTADQFRTGLTMSLDNATLRQEENHYLSLSPDVVRSYPERIQRLLGWASGANHMGWVEIAGQMADPNELLHGATFD
ncbi:phytanoyl-CoA dioxygenase family protein [Phenylobacterium sp. VNQ135]|uniref:phytanoyl-CoA dioxygenase family protein n=1 Tax=Phenylobacterium sp. VNQ135 TaxID=3400922 RepID=UPI003BFD8E87